MADPIDMSGVFAQAELDRQSGKLRYTRDGTPYRIPSYSDLEAQRQSYAAGQEARRATELQQRMQQMNAVSAQQGEALRFPEAGMPKPGTFEAPTDFRTPVKIPPPAPRFSLPELPRIPPAAGSLAGIAGKGAALLSPVGDALAIADLAARAGSAVLGLPSAIQGLANDGALANRDLGKFLDARRDRIAAHPEQAFPFDNILQLLPFVPRKKKSSNLPDYLEPRGQRPDSIPSGIPGTIYLLTISFKLKNQPPASGPSRVTAPFSITSRGGPSGSTLWFLRDANGEYGILDAAQELVEAPPTITGAEREDGVPVPPQQQQQPGDQPSIPNGTPLTIDPSPAPAPRPKPRSTPTPTQAPAPTATPTPTLSPSPRLTPSPVPTPTPNTTPTPAPAAQPTSTPGQSPSPGGGGATLRSPSLNPDRFPDTTLQNPNEPLRSPSLNPDRFPDPPSSRQPDPGTPNSPTKSPDPTIDPTQKPQPQPEPQPQPNNQRQCEDPCIAEMQAQQDANKPTEIKVKVFKACKAEVANSNQTQQATPSTDTTEGNAIFEEKTIKVPKLEVENYKLLYSRIAKLEAEQCDRSADAIASVPEWWQLRAEAQRPQLVVVYAEILGTGKLTKSRWSLTIPHYNRPKGFKPRIPDYNKGNFEGILTLTDNSKIIVNASSEMECKRVINALKILVDSKYRTKDGKAIKAKIGERVNSDFKKCKVTPVRADFYSTGARNMEPDFSINMRAKK